MISFRVCQGFQQTSLPETQFMFVDRPKSNEMLPIIQALLAHLEPEQQKIQFATLDGYSFQEVAGDRNDMLSGLFVCRSSREGQIIGAIWSHRLPGRTVVVGSPTILERTEPPEKAQFLAGTASCPRAIAEVLLEHTCQWIGQRQGTMAQVVLDDIELEPESRKIDPDRDQPDSIWSEFGFQPLVQLIYVLKHFDDNSIGETSDDSNSEFLDFDRGDWKLQTERWSRILAATYQDTLDCPALNGRRTILDTLKGYQATATYIPGGWWIAAGAKSSDVGVSQTQAQTATRTDLGCVILADHPENDLVELVYFGVTSESRGRGIGGKLIREIFDFVKHNNRTKLLAAVDSNNLPALKLYRKYGFGVIAGKKVLARFF